MATNKERVQRAREVLGEYSDRSGSLHGEEPLGHKMSDLITDLMHLHDEEDPEDDWATILQRSGMDYEQEVLEAEEGEIEDEDERTVAETPEQKPIETYSHEAWLAKAKELFGNNIGEWRFKCPCCANEASLHDWVGAGESVEGARSRATVECIGRQIGGRSAFESKGEGPCDYAAFGLFDVTIVRVAFPPEGEGGEEVIRSCFEFGAVPTQEETE